MSKPFTLTPEMEAELDRDVQSLSQADPAGQVPDPLRIPRRPKRELYSRVVSEEPRRDQEGTEDHRPDAPADVSSEGGPIATEPVPEDPINPSHYRRHPSGVECIEITEHMNFCVGNAIKYIWRYQDKGDPVENLKKAQWYLEREIIRLTRVR